MNPERKESPHTPRMSEVYRTKRVNIATAEKEDEEPTIQTTETNVVHLTNREACMYIRPLQNQERSNVLQIKVGSPPRNVPDSQVGRVCSITIIEREELKTTIGFNTNVGHYNQPTLKDTTI